MSDRCKYWDCGWCYAPDNVRTNADAQSACVNPSFCPTTNNTGEQLMTEHPLTDDICRQIRETCCPPEDAVEYDQLYYEEQYMRAATDWQLERVMKCLDEYLDDYSISDRWGYCGANQLKARLAREMRPQENN